GLLERRVQRDRPNIKNHSDDDDGEEFYPKQVRPHVKLARPVRAPRPRLAMMRLGQFGIGLEFVGELIVRPRLMKSQPKKERHQKQHRYNGHVVRRRNYRPKLSPIHRTPGSLVSGFWFLVCSGRINQKLETRDQKPFIPPASSPPLRRALSFLIRVEPAPVPRSLRLCALARSAPRAIRSRSPVSRCNARCSFEAKHSRPRLIRRAMQIEHRCTATFRVAVQTAPRVQARASREPCSFLR